MAWIVDTCVLLDIRIGDPIEYAQNAASCLSTHVKEGLVICPISFIELAPAFRGNIDLEKYWLDSSLFLIPKNGRKKTLFEVTLYGTVMFCVSDRVKWARSQLQMC